MTVTWDPRDLARERRRVIGARSGALVAMLRTADRNGAWHWPDAASIPSYAGEALRRPPPLVFKFSLTPALVEMVKAVRVHSTGGPDVLRYEEVPIPTPGAGQVLVRIKAIGINFIEVYQRTGLYQVKVPFIPGSEAAGVVDRLGEGVTSVKVGQRVASQSFA